MPKPLDKYIPKITRGREYEGDRPCIPLVAMMELRTRCEHKSWEERARAAAMDYFKVYGITMNPITVQEVNGTICIKE